MKLSFWYDDHIILKLKNNNKHSEVRFSQNKKSKVTFCLTFYNLNYSAHLLDDFEHR